ncbi:PPE family protein [Mycolicibacterium goodii]|uniref:PPE domain-containing protein n=1 Tax=Mycolicibacterium goodii TaxID=134601 RepID=UPI001BDD3785|nr:PPE domain-containing protein [Mycolicibacterium goodii]MBU8820336.1 PPE family protein [Mycolicibacterium goodii]
MTEPWPTYTPELNAGRMEAGVGPETYLNAAAAFTALAANFEIQQGVLLAHTGAMDVLWPGLTVAARQEKIALYSGWLQAMVAECMRLATAATVVAAAYTTTRGEMVPSTVAIQNRIDQAIAVATNVLGINTPLITFLDTTYVEHWTRNASAMSLYDAQVITASAPVPKPPPPLLVNPAEPALDAAQQAVSSMAQNTPGSVANQQSVDPSQFMQPVQQAMSAPQALLQPFQQVFSGPQEMAQQLMSSFNSFGNGLGSGGGGDMLSSYSPFAAVGGGGAASLGGAGGGSGAFAGGGGAVSGLRPALSPATTAGGGLTAMSNTQPLTGGSKTAVPASSSALPGAGMGGLGGAGMRGREEPTTRDSAIEAGVSPIADTDSARANAIVNEWLPKRSSAID